YQWGTNVTAVDSATTITIGAGTNSNLEIGNLLEVARLSDNGKEYSGIALVEISEVSEATSKCLYYGADNQPALVQDGIFVADVQKLLLGRSGSKNESR